jgi:hypothetical protein
MPSRYSLTLRLDRPSLKNEQRRPPTAKCRDDAVVMIQSAACLTIIKRENAWCFANVGI